MNDDPSAEEKSAHASRAFARAAAISINAMTTGLIGTGAFSIILLWLQKRSGIRLDEGQYVGVLLFLFVLTSLCAYLVFEYLQHQKDEIQRVRQSAGRPQTKPVKRDSEDWGAILEARLKEFDPLFTDGEEELSARSVQGVDNAASPSTAGADASAQRRPSAPTTPLRDATAALFVQGVTAAIAGLDDGSSTFVQFGIHLFLAGASSELVRRSLAAPGTGKQILLGMLTELGLSSRDAAAFSENANTFAQVPHFRGPIEAGARAIAHLVDEGTTDISVLPETLNLWRMQEDICSSPEPMTFVTTSVAVPPHGTVVTPEDRQRVLRAHATIIPEVLHRFQGREIHNLGNGRIMAFDDATRAIRAAMHCMEELDKYARANPTLPVTPRIGIDSDIAAIVANDYVSAALPRTVTIAAIAPAGQIYCTQAVQDDAIDIFEFQAISLYEAYSDLPPLLTVAWSHAPVHTSSASPLEYRQVGALAD